MSPKTLLAVFLAVVVAHDECKTQHVTRYAKLRKDLSPESNELSKHGWSQPAQPCEVSSNSAQWHTGTEMEQVCFDTKYFRYMPAAFEKSVRGYVNYPPPGLVPPTFGYDRDYYDADYWYYDENAYEKPPEIESAPHLSYQY